ncbi:Glyco_tranf_GTA_type domain containing protein [Candidatus Nanopelagicaceae bacterium]
MIEKTLKNLTAIVPIGKLSDNLSLIRFWVPIASNHGLKIIFVNDAIDFETSENIKSYVDQLSSSDIRLIVGKFDGPGGARNRGLKEVSTEWVCFWDADDMPIVENIAKELAASNMENLIIGQYEITQTARDAVKIIPKPTRNLFDISLNPGLWRFLFRTDIAKKVEFPKIYMGEDQIYLARLSNYLLSARISTNLFYSYTQGSATQLTSSSSRLKDLQYSIAELSWLGLKTTSIEQSKLILTLQIRQCLTLIKRGNSQLRLYGLHTLLFSKLSMNYSVRLIQITRVLKIGVTNARKK